MMRAFVLTDVSYIGISKISNPNIDIKFYLNSKIIDEIHTKLTNSKIRKLIKDITNSCKDCDLLIINSSESNTFRLFLTGYLYKYFSLKQIATCDIEGNLSFLQLNKIRVNTVIVDSIDRSPRIIPTINSKLVFTKIKDIQVDISYPRDWIIVGYLYSLQRFIKRPIKLTSVPNYVTDIMYPFIS